MSGTERQDRGRQDPAGRDPGRQDAEHETAGGPLAPRAFYLVLANCLLVSVIDFTVWFAVTFWVYLETRSVFATGLIGGFYLGTTALTGIWFGSLVDHYRKKSVMLAASACTMLLYALSGGLYWLAGDEAFHDPSSPLLWLFVLLLMSGVLLSNLRGICLPTLVTQLVAEDRRDRVNGLVGTVTGVGFMVTSAISGVLVGFGGMGVVMLLAVLATAAAIVQLATVDVPERDPHPGEDGAAAPKRVTDLRGTLAIVKRIPGLPALIVFAAINNLLFGVFIALCDPYGLNLVSVEVWGFLWAFISTGLIIGGLVVAKRGLGTRPVRVLLLANGGLWLITAVDTLQPSIVLLTIGLFVSMGLMPVVEAAEQTVLQKVVPLERQGRVFGFAQSVEQAASPLTAVLVSPLAQFVTIPLMSSGGAGADLVGGWYGTGPDRGLALLMTVFGLLGAVLTLFALRSRPYRELADRYGEGEPPAGEPALAAAPPAAGSVAE